MARKRNIHRSLAIGLLFVICESTAGMIDSDGMAPWEICGMCHSADGISVMSKFPILAGQKAPYLKSQILDFIAGGRLNDSGQMSSIVTEIEASDIDSIAEYFAGLPGPVTSLIVDSGVDEEVYQQGKALFEEGRSGVVACRTCHNDGHSTAPRLQAQHAAYIRKQLNDFKHGRRVSKRATAMTTIAKLLNEDEIASIAIYLHSSGSYEVNVTP